jgi:hypothetical protein
MMIVGERRPGDMLVLEEFDDVRAYPDSALERERLAGYDCRGVNLHQR